MSRLVIVGLIFVGACAPMDNTATVGSTATMDSVESRFVVLRGKMQSYDVSPINPPVTEPFQGLWLRVRLRQIEILIGQLGSSQAEVDMQMSSLPVADELKDFYILAAKSPDGTLRALQWNFAVSGFCVDRDAARTLMIEEDLLKLRGTSRLKWHPSCNW